MVSEAAPCAIVRGPEATSQAWVGELNSFLVSFPVRVLLSASNKQTLALFSCNILKMDTEMGKHTQLRYMITLAREAARPPTPLAPGPQGRPFPSSWLLALEEGIPGGFCRQSSLTAATTFHLHLGGLGPGVPGAGRPVLPPPVVGQALPGRAPSGHSQGAAWQAARLCGDGATMEMCLHHNEVPLISSSALCRGADCTEGEGQWRKYNGFTLELDSSLSI